MKNIFILIIIYISVITQIFSQNNTVISATGDWNSLIQLDGFDPNNDQQSNAYTDFVGNANYPLMEAQKETVVFSDGVIDDVFYFRVRMGSSNPKASFYFGLDVTGNFIADIFIEANVKSQTPFVAYHLRDYTKSGLSPSQTSWLNGTQNGEQELTNRHATISDYSAGTDLDGGNSGIDFWIEFGFTEESLKSYVQNNLNLSITGESVIGLYGFSSTSQTSNGDVMGLDDNTSSELDESWMDLGIVNIQNLNNLTSGLIVPPTINPLTIESINPTITGNWGGAMLGGDSLTVTINNTDYTTSNGLNVDNQDWSLAIGTALNYGSYDVVATTYRTSNDITSSDITSNELNILPSNNSDSDSSSSSGNNGGLESNNNLAQLISKRNFKRIKSGHSLNKKESQIQFNKTGQNSTILENYLPLTGYNGTEISQVSSPNDLLNITNANEVISVDYYQENNRVAATLATQTIGNVYDHSKVICDRLNKGKINNIWLLNIKGHQIIGTEIEKEFGNIEYSISFSIKLENDSNKLYSFWNISEYPTGDYYNFQVWGNSFLQCYSITNYIINKLQNEKTLHHSQIENQIPQVFVKSGYYSNGKLYLDIINKTGALSVAINGKISETEVDTEEVYLTETIELTGDLNQAVELPINRLFNVGLELNINDSNQSDTLYLADGAWGLDYLSDLAIIDLFHIENNPIVVNNESIEIERQPNIIGELKGTINLFRHLLPGNQTLAVENYNSINLSIQNTQELEIVLLDESLENWENRLRYTLPCNVSETDYNILFTEFKDSSGNNYNINNIKTIVFSAQGDYTVFNPFEVSINKLAVTNSELLSIESINLINSNTSNYPNPFKETTTIDLVASSSKSIEIKVFDLLGRVIDNKMILVNNNKITYKAPQKIAKGIYKYIIIDDEGASYYGSFLIHPF